VIDLSGGKMQYKLKDEKTGEIKLYEVSYSQILQERLEKQLRRNNKLLMLTIGLLGVLLIIFLLVLFNTGLVGYLARAVC
jgi:predicted nucleic acid-binding Zn ribbon protein